MKSSCLRNHRQLEYLPILNLYYSNKRLIKRHHSLWLHQLKRKMIKHLKPKLKNEIISSFMIDEVDYFSVYIDYRINESHKLFIDSMKILQFFHQLIAPFLLVKTMLRYIFVLIIFSLQEFLYNSTKTTMICLGCSLKSTF